MDAHVEEIQYSVWLLHGQYVSDESIVELHVRFGNKWLHGFFDPDHWADLAVAAATQDRYPACVACYITLNPLKPSVVDRDRSALNRLVEAGESLCACDTDVAARRWMFLDSDPDRPPKTNASDMEKVMAWEILRRQLEVIHLETEQVPAIVADSGNGYHALYPFDGSQVNLGKTLKLVASRAANWLPFYKSRMQLEGQFDLARCSAKIDTKVYNPSRIIKLYGTMARKGPETEGRPWRRSRVESTDPARILGMMNER